MYHLLNFSMDFAYVLTLPLNYRPKISAYRLFWLLPLGLCFDHYRCTWKRESCSAQILFCCFPLLSVPIQTYEVFGCFIKKFNYVGIFSGQGATGGFSNPPEPQMGSSLRTASSWHRKCLNKASIHTKHPAAWQLLPFDVTDSLWHNLRGVKAGQS